MIEGTAYGRIKELFLAAAELEGEERRRFLVRECAGAPEDLRAVEAILHVEPDARRALPTLDGEAAAPPAAPARPRELPGSIGPYAVRGLLGEGSMGTVYEVHDPELGRVVALKLFRTGGAPRASRRHFELEVAALARLQHPGIARIYAAGSAAVAGGEEPYIAMELVRGRPLVEHADAAGLDDRGRLALVAEVCDAVHYAHQRGVLHRDLKPSNVLVAEDGRPRLVDFSVARLIDGARATTLETVAGQLVGTIPYICLLYTSPSPRD